MKFSLSNTLCKLLFFLDFVGAPSHGAFKLKLTMMLLERIENRPSSCHSSFNLRKKIITNCLSLSLPPCPLAIEPVSDDLALFVISRVIMITLERAVSSIQIGKGHTLNLIQNYSIIMT